MLRITQIFIFVSKKRNKCFKNAYNSSPAKLHNTLTIELLLLLIFNLYMKFFLDKLLSYFTYHGILQMFTRNDKFANLSWCLQRNVLKWLIIFIVNQYLFTVLLNYRKDILAFHGLASQYMLLRKTNNPQSERERERLDIYIYICFYVKLFVFQDIRHEFLCWNRCCI